jgi:hypothetical protein
MGVSSNSPFLERTTKMLSSYVSSSSAPSPSMSRSALYPISVTTPGRHSGGDTVRDTAREAQGEDGEGDNSGGDTVRDTVREAVRDTVREMVRQAQ